ncbi:MAG: T9SS type A sorting domain-containing protein [Ignavibacteria bacterium]|nr:T9SS type A sorting domain-containing protein [Ignavibacteria bacterium]
MKTTIVICYILLSFGILSAEDECEGCKTKYSDPSIAYENDIGYLFCDPVNNKIVPLCCSNANPYDMPEPYSNWKPLKLCLPLKFAETVFYDNTYIPLKNIVPWSEQINTQQFDKFYEFRDNDIPDIIEAALGYWQNSCTSYNNDDCQPCKIKIAWTKNIQELGDDKALPSHINNPLLNNCKYNCDELSIVLNATSSFSQLNKEGKPSKYFISRGDASSQYGTYLVNADLRKEITYQIGRLLGLANTTAYSDHSKINNPYDLAHSTYSDYDKCAFMLLYCCDHSTLVNENLNITETFELRPNPVNNKLNISFSLTSPEYVNIEIYDFKGNKVLNILDNYFCKEFLKSIDIDLSNLSDGTYLCLFKKGEQVISKFFVLYK